MTTTTDRPPALTDEQEARAEALRVAGNVLAGRNIMAPQAAVPAGRTTDDVLALAEWLLDGSRELEAEPGLAERIEALDVAVGAPYRTLLADAIVVDRGDLRAMLAVAAESLTPISAGGAYNRLSRALDQS